jgi:beta-lactamase class A
MLVEAELPRLLAGAGLTEAACVVQPLDGPPRAPAVLDPVRPLYPASMIKTPLALAVLALTAGAALPPERRVEVEAANMTANDSESPLVPGYRASLAELLDLMITRSDNVATNVLIDVAGRERATALLHDFGFPGTAIRRKLSGSDPLIDDPQATGRNTHPASEAARLFELLAREQLPRAPVLLGLLANQRWNTKLSRGLDSGDRFAHKTGDTSEVSHDGGILTTASDRRYVIVVYTGLPSSDEVDARFAEFMRALRPRLE